MTTSFNNGIPFDADRVAVSAKNTPDTVPGAVLSREITDLTTTIQTLAFSQGLVSVEISYIDLGSAVGDWIFVVFDALSDADAATKLSVPEARVRIMLGEAGAREFLFDLETPCTRLDFASNVASETGDSLVRVLGKVLA